MYADIKKTKEDMVETDKYAMRAKGQQANRKKISKLVSEYEKYKKNKLQNFRFNPDKEHQQRLVSFVLSSHFCSSYLFIR